MLDDAPELPIPLLPLFRSLEEIAAFASEKIATYPAASQNYIQAVILDALNEAVDIERHRADVERKVFET